MRRRVTVMGVGLFGGGAGAVRHFASRGDLVTATDLRSADVLRPTIDALADLNAVRWVLGRHDEADFIDCDLLVLNPAVPDDSPFVLAARSRGVPVATEIGLFLEACRSPVLAITGSNGKTTTTLLLHAILEAAGLAPYLGGNVGASLLPEVDRLDPRRPVVLEISSFQSARLEAARPLFAGSLVTNIVPNHLDRHATFADYVAAKRRVVDLTVPGGTVVMDADDAVLADWLNDGRPAGVHLIGVTDADVAAWSVRPRQLLGSFNKKNLLLAYRLARAFSTRVDDGHAAVVAERFRAIEHRLEVVCRHAGVLYVDDSKSTTPEAAIAALSAFTEPVHLIAGGYDKHLDMSAFIEAACGAASRHFVGQTAAALAASCRARGASCTENVRFDAAVGAAVAAARPGDVVLLSPAHASWGLFTDYRARGIAFRAAVPHGVSTENEAAAARE